MGAIIVAEVADSAQWGRVLGMVQSAWAFGWAAALGASTLVLALVKTDVAWRIVFWLGILPALLIIYVRRTVEEPDIYTRAQTEQTQSGYHRLLIAQHWAGGSHRFWRARLHSLSGSAALPA